jgi:diadenosine tetraphosphate (Ap4A) HIT family hydrolase
MSKLRDEIVAKDRTVSGFNVGMNCGEVAGQAIPHAHIHLIPRRSGDVEKPRAVLTGAGDGDRTHDP